MLWSYVWLVDGRGKGGAPFSPRLGISNLIFSVSKWSSGHAGCATATGIFSLKPASEGPLRAIANLRKERGWHFFIR
jgi:hypothetical protein